MVATSQIAQTTLRSVLGQHVLDELLSERDKINQILQSIIDEATSPWGIKVSIVEVKDVEIPGDMQRAMARQAEAERERRAKVISAEGEFQASERLKDAAAVMAQQPIASSCATCRRCSRSARRTTRRSSSRSPSSSARGRSGSTAGDAPNRCARSSASSSSCSSSPCCASARGARGLVRRSGGWPVVGICAAVQIERVFERPAIGRPGRGRARRRGGRIRRSQVELMRGHIERFIGWDCDPSDEISSSVVWEAVRDGVVDSAVDRAARRSRPRLRLRGLDPCSSPRTAQRSSSSELPTTGARLETCSPSRSRITITPCVERPERLIPSTGHADHGAAVGDQHHLVAVADDAGAGEAALAPRPAARS